MERIIYVLSLLIFLALVAYVVWREWLKRKKEKIEEPKREQKKFILAVSPDGTTIKFIKQLSGETHLIEKEFRELIQEGWTIYSIKAECKDDAIFKLAKKLRENLQSKI